MSLEHLQQLKDQLRTRFLGKGGIHGLGVKVSQNAIQVYVGPTPADDENAVLEAVKAEVQPVSVILRRESPPGLAENSGTEVI